MENSVDGKLLRERTVSFWSRLATISSIPGDLQDGRRVCMGFRNGTILGNPGATSRDNAIFSSEQYFWAKVYFKCWKAPGNLFLPNQFQKWSNFVPLIGQKKYFSSQSIRFRVDFVASSETQGLLAGTMRCFRASDISGRKFTLCAEEPLVRPLLELVG